MVLMTSDTPALTAFSHLTLPVDDLAVAEAFYVGLLGARVGRRFDRDTFVRLRPERAPEADADNSPLHLSLVLDATLELQLFLQRNRPRRPLAPHPHVAFRVSPAELRRLQGRLAQQGVPTDGPRRLGPPGHASVYFADPSGNLLELETTGYEGAVTPGPPDLDRLAHAWRPAV